MRRANPFQTKVEPATAAATSPIEVRKYLRENLLPRIESIDQQVRTGQISLKEAYEQLYEEVHKTSVAQH